MIYKQNPPAIQLATLPASTRDSWWSSRRCMAVEHIQTSRSSWKTAKSFQPTNLCFKRGSLLRFHPKILIYILLSPRRSEEWREEMLADVSELDWSDLDVDAGYALLRWWVDVKPYVKPDRAANLSFVLQDLHRHRRFEPARLAVDDSAACRS